jgi:hypothetical protein
LKVTSGGSELTNGLALYLETNESLTIENMYHLKMFSDYTGAQKIGAYHINGGSHIKLENNRFEYQTPAFTGAGSANSNHYKRYVEVITEGLQLINNVIKDCPWQDSNGLVGRWLLGNVTSINNILYVDYVNGNDNTGIGTNENPYKTINKALSTLPRIIDHEMTIQLKDADYLENIVIEGFQGKGEIKIQGNVTTNTNTRIKGTSLTPTVVKKNTCLVAFKSLGLYCNSNDGKSISIIDNSGVVEISSSVIASWSGAFTNTIGLYAERSPFILSTNNSGSSAVTALNATLGSTIVKNGTQPTGSTNNELVSAGGLIR